MVQGWHFNRTWLKVLMIAVFVVSMGGCSSTAPSRFFELSPVTESVSTAEEWKGSFTVGITRIGIPDYLDRPQIATRIGPNEIQYDEFNRWAGPLKENFSRCLQANLAKLLGPEKVIIDTWLSMVPVDYQIWVEVIRFDAGPQGDVTLTAKWALYRQDEKNLLMTKNMTLIEKANSPGYEAMVSAGSRAIAVLSYEIAEAMRVVR
jgi:uncharacterized lipoprotein YmbA